MASTSRKSWIYSVLTSLQAAYAEIPELVNLPPPTLESIPAWSAAVVLLQGQWPSYLKAWQKRAANPYDVVAEAHKAGCNDDEVTELHQCPWCDRAFAKPVALTAHQKAAHYELLGS
eukprot:991174-Amphidinium_carterae.1